MTQDVYRKQIEALNEKLDDGDIDFESYLKGRDRIIAKRAIEKYHKKLHEIGVFERDKPQKPEDTFDEEFIRKMIIYGFALFFIGTLLYALTSNGI